MIDFTKPVRTVGDKHPVNIFTTKAHGKCPVVGEFYVDGYWYINNWRADGTNTINPAFNLENISQRLAGEL